MGVSADSKKFGAGECPDKQSRQNVFLCRAVGMFKIFRYFATVRWTRSILWASSFSTISSSLRGFFGSSLRMIALSFSSAARSNMPLVAFHPRWNQHGPIATAKIVVQCEDRLVLNR